MTKQPDSKDNNKDKLRVYEYAKSLNMSSKEIITILKRLNLPVNNHMSVMENNMVSKVEGFFRDIKQNAAVKRASETASVSAAATQRPQDNRKPAASSEKSAAQQPTDSNKNLSQDRQGTMNSIKTTMNNSNQQQGEQQEQRSEQQQQEQRSAQQAPRQFNQGGGQGGSRGPGQGGQGGGYRGQGGQGGQSRPAGQGGQGGGYRGQGGGQGGQSRPAGQGGQGGGYRGQGGGQGGQSRPAGQGGQGGGYRGPGQGGGQGGQSRPAGQGGQGGGYRGPSQGGQSRPAGQGGQGGGYRGPGQSGQGGGYRGGQGGGQGGQGGNRGPSQGGGARPSFGGSAPAGTSRATDSRATQGTGGSTNWASRKSKPNNNSNNNGGRRFDDGKQGGNFRSNNGRGGKGGRNNRGSSQQVYREKIDNTPKKIIVRGSMTVGELAKLLHKDASEVIKKLIFMGVMATINQEVDIETIQLIAAEFNVEEVEVKIRVEEDQFETVEELDDEADLETRPPVVTIMGHVDHGKTTLLDAIRHTNVTGGEAGGITQHIGAYQVEINHKKITFLDTPGHEAFTLMRARGAQVTDITIIVVAADDGVMPQTVEAVNHAKAAGVPIIVAVNKIDKPEANPDKIKQELTEYGLVPEEWGGDTIFVNLSAKQRINLEGLLEMILLVAEVNDYKANPNKRARGTVIEAELDKGKGPVARILVQHGTLKVGDAFIAGNSFGRVRAMVNDKGRRLKEAGPSTPVEITGLTEVPLAGDPFLAFEDERKARQIAETRATKARQSELTSNTRVTLDDLYQHIKDGEIKELNVIIKGDVQGSVEALKGSLGKIDLEGVRVKIIHSGAGAITESDINLASASNAIVIGFNVRPEPQASAAAEQEKVDVRLHNIIYNVIDEIEHAMKGMLDPVFKEVVIGHAEVRNLFKVTKVGTIAGCMVTDGKMQRNAEARLLRGGVVLFTGKLDSLKRFKDDAKEVAQGYECGITLDKYNDIQEGDIVEAFVMEKVER